MTYSLYTPDDLHLLRKWDDWAEEGEWQAWICSHRRNVSSVEELAVSQEGQPQTHHSMRQISREIGIHQSSMFHITHEDLGLKCLKKRQTQELTQVNRAVRMQCAKKLLAMYPEHRVDFIWFTNVTIIHFCFQQWKNFQNQLTTDEVIAKSLTQRFLKHSVHTYSTHTHTTTVNLNLFIQGP